MIASAAFDLREMPGNAWANQTTLHPLGLMMTLLCGTALVLLPRRFAVWPFIAMACFVAPAQRLVVSGLDFNLIRLMVLFGFVRILIRSEHRDVRWMTLDLLVLVFATARTLAYTALHASVPALIFQAGQTFDAVGLYFLFRMLIRNWEDVVRTVAGFAVVAAPVLLAFIVENRTGRNVFSVFGGVPPVTMVREGRLRCQGAFAHPIIGGCFWASLLPMFVALWWWGRTNRTLSVVGVVSALGIVLLSSSSTPVMGVIFGAFGGVMFFARRHMKPILIGVVVLMFALHLSMKAPIWHLISRITIAKGNTGYHRFQLIDNAIKRFDEWAALGTKSTAHWFWGGQDITNHYILEAVRGGVVSLLLFISIIWICFAGVGRVWRTWSGDRARLFMSWALGVSLFVHCTNFIAVSYFGQGVFIWYLLLAMIGAMMEWSRRVQSVARLRAARAIQPQRAPAAHGSDPFPHSSRGGLA